MKNYAEVLKQKKGVAGLEVLLALISMLFMIGIIVMVFVIGGAQLQGTVEDLDTFRTTITVTNETGAWLNITPYPVDFFNTSYYDFDDFTVTEVWNYTQGAYGTAWYSVDTSAMTINGTNGSVNQLPVNVSYTFTYVSDETGVDVINDTSQSLGTVTDWFPTFIILGALVVLILLVVIIITSIKRSKITEGA